MLKIYTSVLFLSILLNLIQVISAQSRCKNPNNHNGYCIDIRQCPTLRDLLSKRSFQNDTDGQFLRESQCSNGTGLPPYVCCTEDSEFINTEGRFNYIITSSILPSNGQGNILPNSQNCGRQASGNKLYGGNDTGIDEFQWMVLLEYRMSNGSKSLNCAASLINQRYVLTAAHCVTGRILEEIGPLETIRLGEHDITKTIDCVDGTDCADSIVEVGFEEVIPHEQYNDRSGSRHNDIALIRLDRDINYTYFIRPICLPSTLNLQKSEPGDIVVVSGWGMTLTANQSPIKQKLTIPIVNQERCSQKFSPLGATLSNSQLCAGGKNLQDTCKGDSGGPLMKFENKFWAIEGITSFGRDKCGIEGWPAVYTRVTSFEDWIKNNLKP